MVVLCVFVVLVRDDVFFILRGRNFKASVIEGVNGLALAETRVDRSTLSMINVLFASVFRQWMGISISPWVYTNSGINMFRRLLKGLVAVGCVSNRRAQQVRYLGMSCPRSRQVWCFHMW